MEGHRRQDVVIRVPRGYPLHKVTREKFDAMWMYWFEVSRARVRRLGRLSVPCDCDNPGCLGWVMVPVHTVSSEEIAALSEPYWSEVRKLSDEVAVSKALRWKWLRLKKALQNYAERATAAMGTKGRP